MFKIDKDLKKTEYMNKTFRFPTELVETLQSVAQKEDISLNKLVIQCCRYALENLEKEPGNPHDA